MKLLFIHCGPIYLGQDGKYYEYSYHGLYERYSYLASDITFLMAVKKLDEETKYTQLDDRIRVVPIKTLRHIKTYIRDRIDNSKIIENEIKHCDIAILRQCTSARIAIKYCHKFNKPYIYENVGCAWDGLWNYGLKGKILAPGSFIVEKYINWNAPYVHYVTNKFLQRRYPTKGTSIGCSDVVITPMGEEQYKKRIERNLQLINGKKIIIGTAAALDVPYKGQRYVIEAVKNLLSEGYQIEYWLAGGNEKKSTLLSDLASKYSIEENVKFCGSLNYDQMINFYDSIDLYIQPSKTEGLCRSVIEAMSRGCPTIASNIAGNSELLTKEYLFQKGDVKDIERKIKFILKSDLDKATYENICKSSNYHEDVLETKRKEFYDKFLRDNLG